MYEYKINKLMDELITFSKNNWHYRLIKFTFGIDSEKITNLCPYFWLVVASILICPLSFLKKHTIDRIKIKSLSKSQIFFNYCYLSDLYFISYRGSKFKYFNKTIGYFKSKEDLLKKLKLREEEIAKYGDEFYSKLLKEEELKNKIKTEIPKVTKTFFKSAFILTLFFGFYLIGYILTGFLLFLIESESLFGVMLLVFSSIYSFFGPNIYFWTKEKNWLFIPVRIIVFPTYLIYLLIDYMFKITGIFGKYLKASYLNYCPGINWKNK